jgi:metal-dependent amidase/aminoacylase/carboxypeptidase family protein
LGTPAEEGGGGKILMLEKGCFDKVDFSMMVHPTPYDAIYSQYLAVQNVYVTFKGRAAHAAAFPWEGVNALDAAVLSYNAISMLRQQIKPTWRAHGVFTDGGIEPAIIPEKTQLHYFFRAPSLKELEEFKKKAENCFTAAAEATGEGICIYRKCSRVGYFIISRQRASRKLCPLRLGFKPVTFELLD